MSQKLPALKPDEVCRILTRVGFSLDRQSGSHRIYKHPIQKHLRVTVPYHKNKDLKKGTLASIIEQSGLTVEQFLSHR